MIAFLHLDGFYLQNVCDRRPTVLIRDRRILDANHSATESGIEIGMSLNQAKPILSKNPMNLPAQFLDWKEEEYIEGSERWLCACQEFSDVIEPIDQHRGFIDLSAFPVSAFNSESGTSAFEKLISSVSNAAGIRPRFGAGRRRWMAEAAFLSSDSELLAYFAPNVYLDHLPTRYLLPVSSEARTRLEFLGYRLIGQIREIPLEVLRSQFGSEAHGIYSAARGKGGAAVHPLFPKASLADRFYFESPVGLREPIELAIKTLCRRLGERLIASDLHTTRIRFHIGYESDSEIREREFSKPLLGAGGLNFAVGLLADIDREVQWLRIELLDLKKNRSKQTDLYRSRTDSEDVLMQSVRKMQKQYGFEAVRRGGEIPLTRRQKLLRAWSDATGWN